MKRPSAVIAVSCCLLIAGCVGTSRASKVSQLCSGIGRSNRAVIQVQQGHSKRNSVTDSWARVHAVTQGACTLLAENNKFPDRRVGCPLEIPFIYRVQLYGGRQFLGTLTYSPSGCAYLTLTNTHNTTLESDALGPHLRAFAAALIAVAGPPVPTAGTASA